MNPEFPELDRRLAALRETAATWAPPTSVDARVAAAIAATERSRRPSARWLRPQEHWIALPLALAASIAALSFVVRAVLPHAASGTEPVALSAARRDAFTPVVPVAEIERTGDALVVPARVQRMTLAQFGIPVDPARADDAIDTELLIRRDGALLAYRLVQPRAP